MMLRYLFAILPLLTLALLVPLSPGANGAAVVVDETSMVYSPATPYHSDTIDVAVKVVVSKATLGEGGVVLKHSICTETYCGLPETVVMVLDNATGLYKATIGPYPEMDSSDQPYVDVRFHVEVTATPSDGTSGPVTGSSKEVTLYFQENAPDTDDDEDGNESPFPLLALAPLALSPFVRRCRKRVE